MNFVFNDRHPYFQTTVAFPTLHKKEQILQPLFELVFDAKLHVPNEINTDSFGTFTGEIKRESDVKNVLRKKAMAGIQKTGLRYGLASEGTFGPHPMTPFMNCNQESLLFVDTERKIEIFHNHISTKNQSEYAEIETENELEQFLNQINFGPQAVIVKPGKEWEKQPEWIFKGITTRKEIKRAIQQIHATFSRTKVWIETDNRAHLNPKRRNVIWECGKKLVQKMEALCPSCNTPGFAVCGYIPGLVCSQCGRLSNHPKEEIWRCPNVDCPYQEIKPRLDGITQLDPGECEWCNP